MTDLTITHALGADRTVRAYRASARSVEYARSVVGMTPSGRPKIRGDTLPTPSTIEFRIEVTEASLAASANLAYEILAEAKAATSVAWHEGTIAVDGIARHTLRHREGSVILGLTFVPDGSLT